MKIIIKSLIIILTLVIVVEIIIFGFHYYNGLKQNPGEQQGTNQTVTPTYSQAQLSAVHSDYYQKFMSFLYNEQTDQICLGMNPETFDRWRRQMGVDFASWFALSTYTKGQVESLVLTSRLKGTISDLDLDYIDPKGRNVVFFNFTGEDGSTSPFYENEEIINNTEFVEMVNGEEIPISIEDLQNGDTLIFEATSDLTIPPNSSESNVRSIKVIKL